MSSASSSSSSNGTSKMSLAVVAAAALGIGYCVGGQVVRRQQTTMEVTEFSDTYLPSELQNSAYVKELKLAIRLALKAGRNMVSHIESKGTVKETSLEMDTKSNVADLATAIDVENETFIGKAIRDRFPSHGMIGEEMVGTSSNIPKPVPGKLTWIVDPVDGTTNFANGLPMTCVSIGLCDTSGDPVMGCVYSPITKELFVAVRGCGAFRNGERIFCRSKQAKTLGESVICFEFGSPYRDAAAIDDMMTVFAAILKEGIRASRSIGSGVLDLCYVASGGKIDAVYAGVAKEGWKPWDFCAGSVIVQEAGGCIRSIDAHDNAEAAFDIYSESMICGVSKELVTRLNSIIRTARSKQ